MPRTPFELPQIEAARTGKFLKVVTDPVAILRETTRIQGSARLTLRLREPSGTTTEDFPPSVETLRIFHRYSEAGGEVMTEIESEVVKVDKFGDGYGVSFAIARFGTYLVAMECDRETN